MNWLFGERLAAALRKERDTDAVGFCNVMIIVVAVVIAWAEGTIALFKLFI